MTAALTERIAELRVQALAPRTRRTYGRVWAEWEAWAGARGIETLGPPPEAVADWLVELATAPRPKTGRPLAVSSTVLCIAALDRMHRDRDLPQPGRFAVVASVVAGLKRMHGRAPQGVAALTEDDVSAMLGTVRPGLIGLRDEAVIALGFSAALRRSELVGLDVGDLEIEGRVAITLRPADGRHLFRERDGGALRMRVRIRRSKTDQGGEGQVVPVPDGERVRPVTRVLRWLHAARLAEGPLIRGVRKGGHVGRRLHSSDVPRLIKRAAARAGIDPARYSAHSLRAGFVTCAAAHGASIDRIMMVTRHRNPATVHKYIRHEDAFASHAGEAFL